MTRNEHLTDADLHFFAGNLVVTMARDATEFAANGAVFCFFEKVLF